MAENKYYQVKNISTNFVKKRSDMSIKLAKQKGLSVAIAVVDWSGNLVSFIRMDNASIVSIEVASQKARSAAYLKEPSKVFEDFVNAVGVRDSSGE